MGEKKGFTGKLINDFPPAKSLEVYVDYMLRWHRVISKEFRSWNGPRRIIEYDKQNNPIYIEYNGPIFYYMTNTIVTESNKTGIQHLVSPEPMKPRQSENF